MRKWFKDTDGVDTIWKDPDSTETHSFKFTVPVDVNCDDVTIQSFVASSVDSTQLTIISSSLSNKTITVQVSNVGDMTLTLTMSNTDILPITVRFKERDR